MMPLEDVCVCVDVDVGVKIVKHRVEQKGEGQGCDLMRWWCTDPTASRVGIGGCLMSISSSAIRSDNTTSCNVYTHSMLN